MEKYDYNEAIRREIRKKLNLEGKYVVGHAGRFSDQKNHSFLLDIFQAVHRKIQILCYFYLALVNYKKR